MTRIAIPKIALVGAFDRFNYGDLLFPIIAGNEISEHSASPVASVNALVQSDLSAFGAVPTQPLRQLFGPGHLADGDVVIYAGGGTIGVDWTYMHSNLLGPVANRALYYFGRVFGPRRVDTLSRMYFGSNSPFPWVSEPANYPASVKVAYNAVGGSEFAALPAEVQARTLQCLSKAAYVSVRDAETRRLFSSIENTVPLELAPDSAVLMSEQYPLAVLRQRCSLATLEQLDAGPYVCFQANINYVRKQAPAIIAMLEDVYQRHGLRALLLPIGRYVGLDDQIALRGILNVIRTPAAIVSDQASIWEIMAVLASANLFVGTSLHGNVTSQSFAVPHIGLKYDKLSKLDHYLGSWDLPEQARCIELTEARQAIDRVLAVSGAAREALRSDLIARAHGNFSKLAVACQLAWS